MHVALSEAPFNPHLILADYEQTQTALQGQAGALSSFIGHMRVHNEGDGVTAMRLEHYPKMTEMHLQRISEEAQQQWDVLDTLIVHRVGDIIPGQSIVLVAAWSAHRGEAFAACRYLIEELKHRAPFWKQETLLDGTQRWVTHNTLA